MAMQCFNSGSGRAHRGILLARIQSNVQCDIAELGSSPVFEALALQQTPFRAYCETSRPADQGHGVSRMTVFRATTMSGPGAGN